MFRLSKRQKWYKYFPWFCESLIKNDYNAAERKLQSMISRCAQDELVRINQNLLMPIYNGKETINHDELISLYEKINDLILYHYQYEFDDLFAYNKNQEALKLLHMTAYACMLALKGLGEKAQSTKFEKRRYKFYTTEEFRKCCKRYNDDIREPLRPRKKNHGRKVILNNGEEGFLKKWQSKVPLINIFKSNYCEDKENIQEIKGSPKKSKKIQFIGKEKLTPVCRNLVF